MIKSLMFFIKDFVEKKKKKTSLACLFMNGSRNPIVLSTRNPRKESGCFSVNPFVVNA